MGITYKLWSMCKSYKLIYFSLELKLFFESVLIEVPEGDTDVQVCVRLGGTNWFDLARQVSFELSSDGGM